MTEKQLDVLFVSESPLWPLDQGFRVHGSHMARALSKQGRRVGIASIAPLPSAAPEDMHALAVDWPEADERDIAAFRKAMGGMLRPLRERIIRYYCPSLDVSAGIVSLVKQYDPEVVIGVGQNMPTLLRGIRHTHAKAVWYAADELCNFHLSCLPREPVKAWPTRLTKLAQHFGMERLFARGLDGAIGVSPRDTLLLRCIAGVRRAVTVRNGVDLDYFTPQAKPKPRPQTLIFWGGMSFEPNVDAVCWFVEHVWPQVRFRWPDASLMLVGRTPSPRVCALRDIDGIELVGEVEDIREFAHQSTAVVLPMRCGGGIKNKLLEAAAMGLPILASPHAVRGLERDNRAEPFVLCRTVKQWLEGIRRMWNDPILTRRLRANARRWAEQFHSWPRAAQQLANWLDTVAGKPRYRQTPLDSAPSRSIRAVQPIQSRVGRKAA